MNDIPPLPPSKTSRIIRKQEEKSWHIFLNMPNHYWLQDNIKCLGHYTRPDSHHQQIYLLPSLPPKFSCFSAEKIHSIPILIRNENSEYNWYRSIDFYYKCTWSLGFKKFKINTLFSVGQYKANCFTN